MADADDGDDGDLDDIYIHADDADALMSKLTHAKSMISATVAKLEIGTGLVATALAHVLAEACIADTSTSHPPDEAAKGAIGCFVAFLESVAPTCLPAELVKLSKDWDRESGVRFKEWLEEQEAQGHG